jgi:mono/diheme cytochrome c family protein
MATQTVLQRPANHAGANLYATYCMHCHGADGRGFAPLLAPLAGNPNVLETNATSLINVTLNGTEDLVIDGLPAAYPMPKFANVLSDQQMAEVVTFVRSAWNNHASEVLPSDVAKRR